MSKKRNFRKLIKNSKKKNIKRENKEFYQLTIDIKKIAVILIL